MTLYFSFKFSLKKEKKKKYNPFGGLTCGHVHLLDDVAVNGQTAVVLGRLPLELATFLVNIRDVQRAFGLRRTICRRKSKLLKTFH